MNQYFNNDDRPKWYNEENAEVSELQKFFDVYENEDENSKLKDKAQNAQNIDGLMKDCEFLTQLPYFDTQDLLGENTVNEVENNIEESKAGNMIQQTSLVSNNSDNILKLLSFNKNNAVEYAKKYARKANSHYGYIKNHDCTNFASQIMCASGKSYSRKWITACVLGKWFYTDAWANANCFANYWGVDKTYKTHKNFSKNLRIGDFITEDKANDGSWDHIGFVVNTAKTFNNSLGYKNYRVAQHTSDYLEWASSNKCGWDKLKKNNKNCRFGIIRVE